MIQEDKELLLIDLCARLHYGVFLKIGEYSDYTLQGIVPSNANKPLVVRCNGSDFECSIEVVKPYLRPMSSMTEEEKTELFQLMGNGTDIQRIDFYLSHYFDFRCLIPMGLALEAPKGMYNINEK